MALPLASIETATDTVYDAIVVGSGAVGGLAAALLCEAGLSVLVLDAGLQPSFKREPWKWFSGTGLALLSDPRLIERLPPRVVWRAERMVRLLGRRRQPVQSRCYAWPSAPGLFVDDVDNPFETDPDAPFNWIRAHGLGGRMAVPLHGRQYLRHGMRDFRPTDDLSPPWPFDPDALDPFYAQVERRLGLSGRREGSPWVPDSEIAFERGLSPAEDRLFERVTARWPAVKPMLGRFAVPLDGIGQAAKTGRLSLRTGAVAAEVIVEQGRAAGVAFFDRATRSRHIACAPIVMLGAGALETTRILLNSCDGRLGQASGALGANLMDHVSLKLQGTGPDLGPPTEPPNLGRCVSLPRFESRAQPVPGAGRGFGVRVYHNPGHGGVSHFTAVADAEMMPRTENRVRLSSRRDAWGIPVLHIRAIHSPAELELAKDQARALEELAEVLGIIPAAPAGLPGPPGSAIHKCGTARMGDDPTNSVTDPFNECWGARGLYVSDGAAFPSEGIQNPTLTMMALTARACARIAAG